jgi:serine/threonine protein kinase
VFIKEVNMPFIKLYRVISILGVGAFGVVLEVENMVTKEISALKVIPFL